MRVLVVGSSHIIQSAAVFLHLEPHQDMVGSLPALSLESLLAAKKGDGALS